MSSGLLYVCSEDVRRARLRKSASGLNGIDFLEVVDSGVPRVDRQRILRVHFVKQPLALAIVAANVRIEGGERIAEIPVEEATVEDDVLVVRTAVRGDHSSYRLSLVEPDGGRPLAGLDPLLATVEFSFKVDCPSDFDCRPACECAPRPAVDAGIDYLARDYESVRRLLLERMSLLVPDWEERNAADQGIVLVELLAYLADRLSYEQDAIATEAYLGTARRRISARRHATLLDYPLHDGCNARTFVQVKVTPGAVAPLRRGTPLLTELGDGQPVALGVAAFERALGRAPEVFEAMHGVTLREEHNEIAFHAWGERECCLPRGATRATLVGHLPHLGPGELLLLEEAVGPRTGLEADADPARRHVVRLLGEPSFTEDPLFGAADDDSPRPLTEVEWGVEDALPFPLCLSARTDAAHGGRYVDGVSVARGNVVLVDHGRTVGPEDLGIPPGAGFRPQLEQGPLTQSARIARSEEVKGVRRRLEVDHGASAAAALRCDPARALPAISLRALGATWHPRRDLLSSDGFAREFVAECEERGAATLRFGDGEHGAQPTSLAPLEATYRVGNGRVGNIGAGAIRHLVADDEGLRQAVVAVGNPLPARGGSDPESLERVRTDAPQAFRRLSRAVTPEDYAEIAARHPEVQGASATVRWTGSWRTVYLTVDRRGGLPVDADFEAGLRAHLEAFRMAGHDLEIDAPRFVAIELELEVCVEPAYFRGDVERALAEALGSGTLPDGRRGHFHVDNLSFGEPVRLSPIVAAAAAVAGVRDVGVAAFQRLGVPSRVPLEEGLLRIGRLEVARLANDPSFPERGVLRLRMAGGR